MSKGDQKKKEQKKVDAIQQRIVDDPGFALHYAAESGDIDLAAINLDQKKVDANYIDETGFTPLFRAVMQKQEGFISFILKKGADPNIQTHEGFTALMAAAESGSDKILKMLLDHGANPNLRSIQGATSLHIAASLGHIEIIKQLLNAGADAAIRDNTDIRQVLEQQTGREIIMTDGDEERLKGLTALDVAKMCGHREAEELLSKAT